MKSVETHFGRWRQRAGEALRRQALRGCLTAAIALMLCTPARAQLPGEIFQDCQVCPQMVMIPAGRFLMGSPADEVGRFEDEGPQRSVMVPSFSAGRYEVTRDEYDACVSAGACAPAKDDGFGGGRRPVTLVSWNEARAYAAWLSAQTRKTYRLLTEAEWEYAARGGSLTAYWWGEQADRSYANYGTDQCCRGLASGADSWLNTSPAGSFPANPFGLHDMNGNVWEFVEDCYAQYYVSGQPTNGSPFMKTNCTFRVYRGGSWSYDPRYLRSAYRSWTSPENRSVHLGFRVARSP